MTNVLEYPEPFLKVTLGKIEATLKPRAHPQTHIEKTRLNDDGSSFHASLSQCHIFLTLLKIAMYRCPACQIAISHLHPSAVIDLSKNFKPLLRGGKVYRRL